MKYVTYLRVSTKEQGKSGLGLEAQRAIIEHYCTDGEIVREFLEVASGKDISNRNKLQEAIKEAKRNNYTLVVAKLDRLSRDVEHVFKIHKELNNGLLFKSCDLPNSDSLTLSIFAGLAQREREIISIRTKAALKAKKERGAKLGTPQNLTPEGRAKAHRANKEKARKNPNNLRAMELIHLYRNNGLTLEQIANKLNTQGFRSSKGKEFHKTTVSRLHKRYLQLQEV